MWEGWKGDAARRRTSCNNVLMAATNVKLVPPSPERSRNMAAIRSRDTAPELLVRRAVHAAGFRFRLHSRKLPGRPDLVFPRYRVAVFVHGCFWHGHVCKEARRPRSNLSYWTPKIDGNVARDARNVAALRRAGWHVFVVRECTARSGAVRIIKTLRSARKKTKGAHLSRR